MTEKNEQAQQRIPGSKYSGHVSAICGVIIVVLGVGIASSSSTPAVLSPQTAAVVLGGTGMALDGIFRITDPSPPESDRERTISLLKTMLFLGLVLGGFYGSALF